VAGPAAAFDGHRLDSEWARCVGLLWAEESQGPVPIAATREEITESIDGEHEGQTDSIRQLAGASFIGTAIEWYDC
jgi:hypothetical protein